MTELQRRKTRQRQLKNDVEVWADKYNPRTHLRMIPRNPSFETLSVSLTSEEVDDLIVMLEYHRREANNAFAEKQAGKDPD